MMHSHIAMDYFRQTAPKYAALEDGEYEIAVEKEPPNRWSKTHRTLLALAFFTIATCAYILWAVAAHAKPLARSNCTSPDLRKEWRTLSLDQKHAYIHAVKCAKTKPSRLGLNHSAYDDFPWVHSRVGAFGRSTQHADNQCQYAKDFVVHNAAPFLAWHRYFLHIYETTLKEECAYTGSMPYVQHKPSVVRHASC
jgi:hypothetical protein